VAIGASAGGLDAIEQTTRLIRTDVGRPITVATSGGEPERGALP
jgi:chemotaxis response regulator CheB